MMLYRRAIRELPWLELITAVHCLVGDIVDHVAVERKLSFNIAFKLELRSHISHCYIESGMAHPSKDSADFSGLCVGVRLFVASTTNALYQ